MYKLMKHPEHQLPVLVSILNPTFIDFMMAGYSEIESGTRKYCETQLAIYMAMYCEGYVIELN